MRNSSASSSSTRSTKRRSTPAEAAAIASRIGPWRTQSPHQMPLRQSAGMVRTKLAARCRCSSPRAMRPAMASHFARCVSFPSARYGAIGLAASNCERQNSWRVSLYLPIVILRCGDLQAYLCELLGVDR